MTDKEYNQLQELLSKLQIELGHSICIIPNYTNEGVHIGRYFSITGYLRDSVTAVDIKTAVKKLIAND